MSEIKEITINDSFEPISMKTTEIILDQMNCVCKIHIEDNNGTSFVMKIPYNNNHLTVLITNNHKLNEII